MEGERREARRGGESEERESWRGKEVAIKRNNKFLGTWLDRE